MEDNPGEAWFVGDLGDPWVLSIAEALPRGVVWVSCPGDFPEEWAAADGVVPPETLVIHRAQLNATDASRLGRLLSRASAPVRVLLCVGPHVRHDDQLRWSRLAETILPEATAAESLARRFSAGLHEAPGPNAPRIHVLSTDFEWRTMVADLCRTAGYEAVPLFDDPAAQPTGLIVWDVPLLRDDWPARLKARAENGRVVAVMGFVDRDLVELARRSGASACLDAPFDAEDLVWILDKLAQARPQTRASAGHIVPPPPAFTRHPKPEHAQSETLEEPRTF